MKTLSPTVFGTLSDGREVTEYVLKNRHGMSVSILDYGGIIRALEVPDKLGNPGDIVLGFDDLHQYEGKHPYFGAVIGRVAGRIDGGLLRIDGVDYQLSINDAPNHLHGGAIGFDHRLWHAEYSAAAQSLALTYESADGEEGYPGRLHARVVYRLMDANELIISYRATTDDRTVANLTQHSYFNLSGDPTQSVLDHSLTVHADRVLELNSLSIPTGRILDVTGSRFDFRQSRKIGDENNDGCDHYWVLAEDSNDGPMSLAAQLCHEDSGRLLHVLTSAPGVQIYTGNALSSGLIGKRQVEYGPMAGVCFETQVHPDSPNHQDFPGITVDRKSVFESTTVFRFLVRGGS